MIGIRKSSSALVRCVYGPEMPGAMSNSSVHVSALLAGASICVVPVSRMFSPDGPLGVFKLAVESGLYFSCTDDDITEEISVVESVIAKLTPTSMVSTGHHR